MHLLDGLIGKRVSVSSMPHSGFAKSLRTHNVVDQARHDCPWLCLANVNLLHIQGVRVRVLLDCDNHGREMSISRAPG